jgi:hypothetical protein
MTVEDRLDRIEQMLSAILERQQVRQWYSIDEFSRIVGRSVFTCQSWCRNARISARKKESGRGAHLGWAISNEELLRYQREGLLPCLPPAWADGEAKRA